MDIAILAYFCHQFDGKVTALVNFSAPCSAPCSACVVLPCLRVVCACAWIGRGVAASGHQKKEERLSPLLCSGAFEEPLKKLFEETELGYADICDT